LKRLLKDYNKYSESSHKLFSDEYISLQTLYLSYLILLKHFNPKDRCVYEGNQMLLR